jgi:allantoicase
MRDFTELVDLAAEKLGGRVLYANDDFFAPKENLLKAAKPVFLEGKYTSRGKWMDGWESRRRRAPGHDWCLIRLGLPGIIRGFVVDTAFFTGNYPDRCSIEACSLAPMPAKAELKALRSPQTEWTELLHETKLSGDSRNIFAVGNPQRFTHLRFHIFPDGGVARLRVHGDVVPSALPNPRKEINLVSIENGGSVIGSSDRFFGEPLNLLMPWKPVNMGDGWETKRRRGPGHDWVIVKLGYPGKIRVAHVSTAHFKGNYPDSCSLETMQAPGATTEAALAQQGDGWKVLLAQTKLKPDHGHVFRRELQDTGPATHVRLSIFPDGGVGRLRLLGVPVEPSDPISRFHRLPKGKAQKALLDCCGSKKWVARMLANRPFADLPAILHAADAIWKELDQKAWREAFLHHPPIGGRKARARQSGKAKNWSAGEQSAAQQGSAATLDQIAAGNAAYQRKFGHVFLICATGKTAGEILESLERRMNNEPSAETLVAAEEQRKITRLRLEKLLR